MEFSLNVVRRLRYRDQYLEIGSVRVPYSVLMQCSLIVYHTCPQNHASDLSLTLCEIQLVCVDMEANIEDKSERYS